ncbi:MAG: hypothetical protein ACOYD4_03985 [Solirubrobacterales bacterium]
MKTITIVCPELEKEMEICKAHHRARGVVSEYLCGIHAETFGILAWKPYRLNRPTVGECAPMASVGLCLSHYMAWTVAAFNGWDQFLLLEADCRFPPDWQHQMKRALEEVPDFDILLVGNAGCMDKPKEHIMGSIYEVKYPFCTHAMVINHTALPTLLADGRDCSMPIDILLMTKIYPKLRVFTCWPRIFDQVGTDLLP